ncbi:MAG TPA: hypothetical protein VLC07_03200 [Solirubrobacterales bacterium]|nr:hypothetical protein [Solirubrobacterales bacterium]
MPAEQSNKRVKRLLLELTDIEQEALHHELSGPYAIEVRSGIFGKLRAALDSPPIEERVEYRVYADSVGGGELIGRCADLGDARRRCVGYGKSDNYTNVRIQSRSITTFSDGSSLTSPWTDLPSEEGER